MHVALDRGHDDPALRLGASGFFRFHKRHQVRDCLFHHTRTFDDLRQKHFARSKKIADYTHPRHQRPFDYIERPLAIFPCLFGIDVDVINDAFDQGML